MESQVRPGNIIVLRGAGILWICALMLYVMIGAAAAPFHADESTQMMMSRDYHYQFVAGEWEQLRYQDPPLNATEQHLRLLNGTVSKYVMGLAWDSAGFTVDDLNDQWLWGAGWDWNVDNGHMPSDRMLVTVRLWMAGFTAFSVPLIFAIGWLWRGRWAAFAASLLFATQPVVLLHGRRAYMESTLLFFSLLTILLSMLWINRMTSEVRGRRYAIWLLPLGLGVSAGFTIASKHSGAVPVFAAYVAILMMIVWLRGDAFWRRIAALAVSSIVALAVFYVLNPAWWGDPVARFFEVLALRVDLVADQSATFPDSVYADGWARLLGLFEQMRGAPLAYYEVPIWADYIAEPITRYEATSFAGLLYGTNVLTTVLGWLVFGVALVGAGVMGHAILRQQKTTIMLAIWLILTVAFILITIPLAWQRYYMPLYPLLALLFGAGVTVLQSWVVLIVSRWRVPDSGALRND